MGGPYYQWDQHLDMGVLTVDVQTKKRRSTAVAWFALMLFTISRIYSGGRRLRALKWRQGHAVSITGPPLLLAAGLSLLLALLLLLGSPSAALASTGGWQVEWDEVPAAYGPAERLSINDGRVVYISEEGKILLFDAESNTTTEIGHGGLNILGPAIERDWVTYGRIGGGGDPEGLYVHQISTGTTRKLADGHVYDMPQLEDGRILWTGGTNQNLVLNLYDIAAGTNTALNEGTRSQSLPLLLNGEWVVWREHQDDGSNIGYAYDISSGEKQELPQLERRRLYALIGDQVVVSATQGPAYISGLALLDLQNETLTELRSTRGSSIAYVVADEEENRLVWTASEDRQGAYVAVYDLENGATQAVPIQYYSLGPIEVSGDLVLFRGEPREGIYRSAPSVLFAYQIGEETLTNLGDLLLPSFPFATDGIRAFWFGQVLENEPPRLPPRWSPEYLLSPDSALRLFVARAPAEALHPFGDVSGTHPYQTAIMSLYDRGAVQGYTRPGGAAFASDHPYLRAQYAKVMVESLGLRVSEDLEAPFWDLGPDDPRSLYPHDYIAAAARAGLIKGYANGAFRPWAPVSRAQLATMVVRAASVLRPGLLLPTPDRYTSLLGPFDPTHAPNLDAAQFNGLMNGMVGYDRQWEPWVPASRGEGAQILWNLLRIDLTFGGGDG